MKTSICALLTVMTLAACRESDDSAAGYYGFWMKLGEQDCIENPQVGEPLTLGGTLEVFPRPDLPPKADPPLADGPGVYYFNLATPNWTQKWTEVLIGEDGLFEASGAAPNFDRPETGIVRGRYRDGRIEMEYVQDRPAYEGRPACQINWTIGADRYPGYYEAALELVEQDCEEDMGAYAHGFLLRAKLKPDADGRVYEFKFDSPNWWLTFPEVPVDGEGRFDVSLPSDFPYQPETWRLEGTFDGLVLKATYVQERAENDSPDLGYWPECRIAWNVTARLIE